MTVWPTFWATFWENPTSVGPSATVEVFFLSFKIGSEFRRELSTRSLLSLSTLFRPPFDSRSRLHVAASAASQLAALPLPHLSMDISRLKMGRRCRG